MWEGSGADLTGKLTLNTTELVLEILSLLAEVALCRVWPDGFDGVANAHDLAIQALSDNREVVRQRTVIVNEQNVFEILRSITTNKLSNDFRSDWRPDMIHAVRTADLFRIVEWCRAVSVGDDEYIRWREDLQGSFECVGNESSRLIARNHEAGIVNVGMEFGLCREVGERWILLEKDE